MSRQPSNSILIASMALRQYAVGETIEDRFKAIITPMHITAGCWLCRDEDEQFRAAVGGLMLSYETGSPEQRRISLEMEQIDKLSLLLQAAELGMTCSGFERPDDFVPIGLLRLWKERER